MALWWWWVECCWHGSVDSGVAVELGVTWAYNQFDIVTVTEN